MKKLFEALTTESQDELLRDHIIDLVNIVVKAGPDPERPDDRLALKIVAEIDDAFAPGRPETEAVRRQIREICNAAGDDFSLAMQDSLRVALNRRRKELDQLREGKIHGETATWFSDPQTMEFLGPIFRSMRPEVTVWSLAWTLSMDDDGKLLVDCEDTFTSPDSVVAVRSLSDDAVYAEDRNGETRKLVLARIGRVNDMMGRAVALWLSGC
jgi:hypothetical protein